MSAYVNIINAWINNTKAPKNSRMFYEGDTLYSYGKHYPMARIDREKNLVLINSTKSSVTTERHKGLVRYAVRQVGYAILYVPNPYCGLTANLAWLRDELQRAIDAANNHMIKPNMLRVEECADRFDALASYMDETTNIMNTKIYGYYLTLKDKYNVKRNK